MLFAGDPEWSLFLGFRVKIPGTKWYDASFVGPLLPLIHHVGSPVSFLERKIVHLSPILLHIVEFPFSSGILGYQLPFPVANRAITFVFEEEGLPALEWFPFDGGPE